MENEIEKAQQDAEHGLSSELPDPIDPSSLVFIGENEAVRFGELISAYKGKQNLGRTLKATIEMSPQGDQYEVYIEQPKRFWGSFASKDEARTVLYEQLGVSPFLDEPK